MEYETGSSGNKKPPIEIIVALIGASALVLVAMITYWKDRDIAQIPILATQTAEAKLTQIAWSNLFPSTPTRVAVIPPTAIFTPKPSDTPRPPATVTLGIGSSKISPNDGATMMYVPAGEFTMGSESGENDEKPPHRVYLDAFWMDRNEVTNALYTRCVDASVCRPPQLRSNSRTYYYGNSEYKNYPVIYVSWNDANAYCSWVDKRLPTEAEWEKTARGTDGRVYPWGNSFDKILLNSVDGGKGDTIAVGTFPGGTSPYGALDMAGNVFEWVADWYLENYYSISPQNNPKGPISGTSLVLRGGSWDGNSQMVRTSFRKGTSQILRLNDVGFRCAQ